MDDFPAAPGRCPGHPAAPDDPRRTELPAEGPERHGPTVSPEAFLAVLCGDGLRRCPWAPTGPAALAEHDLRWGLRPVDAPGWFEALCLEILQAGLAPWSAARRRDGLRRALRGFVPEALARLCADDVDELLRDPGVIRNRTKLEAVVRNARSCAELGPGDWARLVEGAPPAAPPRTVLEETRRSAAGDALAGRLRAAGMVLVGPATAHRVLLRTGVLPGHLAGCFRTGTGSAGSG